MYQSPYIGQRIGVLCADMEDPYNLPIDILRQCPKMSSLLEGSLTSETIHLKDVNEAVGHVIVHFLHTGIYQCLQPDDCPPLEKKIIELRTSVRVYVAARAYELPVLAKLASLETEILSDDLDLPTIIDVFDEAYPRPPVDDAWISEYLKSRIGGLLSQPRPFCVGNKYKQNTTSIAQICVQSLMDICQAKSASHDSVGVPAEADQNNVIPPLDPIDPVPSPSIDHCAVSEPYLANIDDDPLEDHAVLYAKVYQSKEPSVVAEAAEYPEAMPLDPENEGCPSAEYSGPEEEACSEEFPALQEEENPYAEPPIAEDGYSETSAVAGEQYEYGFPESPVAGVEEYPPTESPTREVEEYPPEESPVSKSEDYLLAEPSVPDMIEAPPSEEPMPVKTAILLHEAYDAPVIYEEVPETMFDINPDGALVAEDSNHETTSSIEDSPLCVHEKKGKRCFKYKKARESFK